MVWACVLTWAFSAITLALLGASLTLLLADPSLVWAELDRQNPGLVAESGLTRDDLMRTTYVTLGVAAVWALVAIVLAVLAYRRRRGRPGSACSSAPCVGRAGLRAGVVRVGAAAGAGVRLRGDRGAAGPRRTSAAWFAAAAAASVMQLTP